MEKYPLTTSSLQIHRQIAPLGPNPEAGEADLRADAHFVHQRDLDRGAHGVQAYRSGTWGQLDFRRHPAWSDDAEPKSDVSVDHRDGEGRATTSRGRGARACKLHGATASKSR